MSHPQDLLTARTDLGRAAIAHLHLLLADWQILADLSFADLLMFVRQPGESGLLCVGQMRPLTAQTIYVDDLLGRQFAPGARPLLERALSEEQVIRDTEPDWSTGVPVREEAIPVRLRGRTIAVVSREASMSTARSPSELELTYLRTASELVQMLTEGTFPFKGGPAHPEDRELSPRVGDGVARLDAGGTLEYASPNAISALRRLQNTGTVLGLPLPDVDPGAASLLAAMRNRRSIEEEVEAGGAVVLRRLLPLLHGDDLLGALVLLRDVTELRLSQRELRIKEATIREIHHRVKNNLQTVASLLRLQARRLRSDEARAALDESVRRIFSIALVHETLSQEPSGLVAFDEIAQRIVAMMTDGLMDPDGGVSVRLAGDLGPLPAPVATPLALVLTELLQNSVEHGFPDHFEGTRRVLVRLGRGADEARIVVADTGVGLPADRVLDDGANLGLQIVRTFMEAELGGTVHTLEPHDAASLGGATFELRIPLVAETG